MNSISLRSLRISRLLIVLSVISMVFMIIAYVSYALNKPTVTLSPSSYTDGPVTLSVSVNKNGNETLQGIRWVPGNHSGSSAWNHSSATDISFNLSNNTATGSFTVNVNGEYTVVAYAKNNNNNNNVYQVTVVTVSQIDRNNPVIVPTISPTGITNTNVVVTANATDSGESGIKQTKWAEGQRNIAYFSTAGTVFTNSFTVSQNGFVTIYAEDNSGKKATSTLEITNISKIKPTAPVIDLGDYTDNTWTKNSVMVVLGNSTSAIGIKQYEYNLNNGSWSTYLNPFTVTTTGVYTVLAHSIDNAGNVSENSKVTIKIDKTNPILTLSQTTATQEAVTVTAAASDTASGIAQIKYLPGSLTVNDFQNAGTDITATGAFIATENGNYTVYASDVVGNGIVKTIQVTSIKSTLSYTEGEFLESESNDGSIATVKYVTLSSGKFTNTSAFVKNTHYQLSKAMPDGLNFNVTRENDTTLKLSFTGKATNHEAVYSILTDITFTDNAFASELRPASTRVINYQHNLTLRFIDRPQITVEGGEFEEAPANDGSIAGTKALILTGAKLTTNNITNKLLVENTHYRITGVPAGLTAVVTRESSSRLKLMLTGYAASHTSADSINNLKLTLLPAAFDTSLTVSGRENTFSVNFIDKRKLRVLEVYPSKIFDSGEQGGGDYRDAASLPSTDYEVTSMSMNRFISLVDDVNGNYDIVYFGRGIYSNGGPRDAYYGNDITNLAANKVKQLIDGGLLCVFHEKSLVNSMTNMTGAGVKTKMYDNFNPYFAAKAANPELYPNVVMITSHEQIESTLEEKLASAKINQRPILSVYEKPFSYRDLSMPLDNNILEFTFIASDAEDATLQAQLYLDRNNDGLFQDSEVAETHIVNRGKGDTFYYTMPTGLTGVYFWKLVVKDSKGAESEITDIFYLKGDQITVNVLQVYPPNNNLDLSTKLKTALESQPADTLGYRYGEYKVNVTMASIDEFNAVPSVNDPKFLGSLNGHYNMIIFGFYDNYDSKDLSDNAANRLKSFIETNQSVMFTHDMIADGGGMPNTAKNFKAALGQTAITSAPQIARYAVNDWNFRTLGTSSLFNGYNLNNGNITTNTTKGNMTAMDGYSQFLPDSVDGVANLGSYFPGYRGNTSVKKINSTAMTLYPFNIESVPQSGMQVAKTHNQYFKLDLEDPELIPVFSLYREGVDERFNDDAMNNYYTYSKGNLTYSGTGHIKASQAAANYPEFELKMFVNTMLKAYASSNHAPVLNVYQPTPNTKLDLGQSTFRLSFRASDYDEGDETLYYRVFLDKGNNGSYTEVGTETPVNRGTLVNLDIAKGFSDIRAFKCKVEVRDSHNAKAQTEILLYNTDSPSIKPEIITDSNTYFAGEPFSIKTKLTPSGNVIPDMDIKPVMDIIIPAGVSYLGSTGGHTITDNSLPVFRFTDTGPTTAPVITEPVSMLAPLSAGTYTVKTRLNYSIDGTPVHPQPEDSIPITVLEGQVEVHVVDTQGNPMTNVAIKDNDVNTGEHTNSGGRYMLTSVSRGTHKYSIDVPEGYVLVNKEVMQSGQTFTEGDTLTVSADAPSWQVKFTLKLAITVPIKYYNILPNNDVRLIGEDTGNQSSSTTYELRTKKNSKVRIAALVSIPDIDSNDIEELSFEVTTEKEGEVPVASEHSAKIVGPLVPWPFFSGPGNQTEALRDPDIVRLGGVNTTPPAGGTFAGKSYYVIIEIEKANDQKFWISKIAMKMANGSTEVVSNSNVSIVSIKELLIPRLQ